MRLTYEGERYVAVATFDEKDIPKGSGFLYDWDSHNRGQKGRWWTKRIENAVKLINFADELTRKRIEELVLRKQELFVASSAATTLFVPPSPPGLSYKPFQCVAIEIMMQRVNNLLADDMGLGKTIEVLGLMNADQSIKKVLVAAKNTLKLNWRKEALLWLINKPTIAVLKGSQWQDAEMVIVNYDILHNFIDQINAVQWDLLVLDESHMVKNQKIAKTKDGWKYTTRRVEAVDKIIKSFRKRVFVTGTPMKNRPCEIYTTVNWLARGEFGWKFRDFADEFCAAYTDKYGYHYDGASNLDELQRKLRSTIMIRRMKSEVELELPDMTRQVLELPSNGNSRLVAEEKRMYDHLHAEMVRLKNERDNAIAKDDDEAYKRAIHRLKELRVGFEEMSKVRHQMSLAKIPLVVEYVMDCLETVDKIVVFGHHGDFIESVVNLLNVDGEIAIKLIGGMSAEQQFEAVNRFQTDPKIKVIVVSMLAGGEGTTLTASSHIVFGEFDWVPGTLSQCEKRCDRIGQKNTVLAVYMVFEDSLDVAMLNDVFKKMEVLSKALNADRMSGTSVIDDYFSDLVEVPKSKDPAPQVASSSVSPVKRTPSPYTDDQKAAMITALRILAGVCDGARSRDNAGFNGTDTNFGKSLAERNFLTDRQAFFAHKILRKYSRQLPEDIYRIIYMKESDNATAVDERESVDVS